MTSALLVPITATTVKHNMNATNAALSGTNKGKIMQIQTFINEFKLTFVYDLLRQTLTDEQLFEHSVQDGQVIWMKEQTRQMWHLWTTAAAEEVPDGFALVRVEEIKEGGVMDIKKEREAFDKWHYEQYLLENPNIDIANAKYIYDYAHNNALVYQLRESHFTAWQAAKAQAVPKVINVGNELQSWVAVWSFKARHDHEDYIVVDANLLAEKIEILTGANA